MDERKQDDQIADIKTFFVEEKINLYSIFKYPTIDVTMLMVAGRLAGWLAKIGTALLQNSTASFLVQKMEISLNITIEQHKIFFVFWTKIGLKSDDHYIW